MQNNLRLQLGDEIPDVTASHYLSAAFGAGEAASFWKRGSFRSGSRIRSELFRLTRSASQQQRSSLVPSRTPGFEAPMCTRVAPVSQSVNGGSCRRSLPRAFNSGSADRTRQTLKAGQRSSLATTAEELLPPWQPCRRSYAHSEAGRTGRSLESPNLLCSRPDVYVKSWAVGD